MAVTLSTNVDDGMASKVRAVAEKEHRSVSNVVSSAIAVFTGLPKEVRDTLLELQSHDASATRRFSREMMATLSRLRLDMAAERLAGEGQLGKEMAELDELGMLEEATRLTGSTKRANVTR
jgi:predicted transcriptional regulator